MKLSKEFSDNFCNQEQFKDLKKGVKFEFKNLDSNERFNLTNNGFYSYKTGYFEKVFYCDVHSLFPLMAYFLNIFDDEYKKMFEEKILLDKKIDNSNHLKVNDYSRREYLKKQLNMKVSNFSASKKENRKIRNTIVDESLQFMNDIINDYFDWNNVVHLVNDGFFYVLKENETYQDCLEKINKICKINDKINFTTNFYDFIIIENQNNIFAYNYKTKNNVLKTDRKNEELENFIQNILENDCLKNDEEFTKNFKKMIQKDFLDENLEKIINNEGVDIEMYKQKKDFFEMVKPEVLNELPVSSKLMENKKNNPKYIIINKIEKNPLLEDNITNIYTDFPHQFTDFRKYNNKKINYKTTIFGEVELFFTNDETQIKNKDYVEKIIYFLLEDEDLRLMKHKLKDFYIDLRRDFKDNKDDFDLNNIRMLTLAIEEIGMIKGKTKKEINDMLNEISNVYDDEIFINSNIVYQHLLFSPTIKIYNNDVYFFCNNKWDHDEDQIRDWFFETFNLEHLNGKEHNKIWKDYKMSVFDGIRHLLSEKPDNNDETCITFKDNVKVRYSKENTLNVVFSKDNFYLKKLPITFDEYVEYATPENKEKVMTFLKHLTNNDEKELDKIITLLASSISYDQTLREKLNVVLFLIGEPGTGKSTLLKMLRNAVGDDYLLQHEKINLDENSLSLLVGKNILLLDDVKEFNKPGCVLNSEIAKNLGSFVDGRDREIKHLFLDKFMSPILVTPIILSNYEPTIKAKNMERRSIIVKTDKKIIENKELMDAVSEDELLSKEMSIAFLDILLNRLKEIKMDINTGKVKNNRNDLVKFYYGIDLTKKEENNNVFSDGIKLILDDLGITSNEMQCLIGMNRTVLFNYIKQNYYSKVSLSEFEAEINSLGYEFKKIVRTNKHGRKIAGASILQKKNEEGKMGLNNKIHKEIQKYLKSYGENSASFKRFDLEILLNDNEMLQSLINVK